MAGTFSTHNKVRPGAYTVFKAVNANNVTSGSRGIVAIPMNLSWGDTSNLIEVSASDFVTGATLQKLGLVSGDAGIVLLREVFKNASTALVGRLNASPVKATKSVPHAGGDLEFVAQYGGTLGNKITVSGVTNSAGTLELITTVAGTEVDRQAVATVKDFKPNGWITIVADEDLAMEAFAGTTLEGGTDGAAITAANYTGANGFTSKCSDAVWNVMAVPETTLNVQADIVTFIKDMRENRGRKVQAVVYNYPAANYEGIISVDQGYYIGDEEVNESAFTCFVAGATAGADVTESNTYKVVEGATAIKNPKSAAEIETALQSGKLVLSRRQDRAVVIEKDINTLYSFPADRSYAFSKNRVIRCLDDIAMQITSLFENSYIGRVSNTESNRTLFKGEVIGYLNGLQAREAIQNFDSTTDIEILAGNDIESVIVNVAIQPVDSMEKLYMTVTVS